MATSQVVNLAVGSEFGFKRPAFAPVPIMETIKSFNTTTTIPGTLANTSSRVIVLGSLNDFEFTVGNTSTLEVLYAYGSDMNSVLKSWTAPHKQTLTISNIGNAAVTMFPRSPWRPIFSLPPVVQSPPAPGPWPVLHSINGQDVSTSTFIIDPGTTGTVEIAYYSSDVGEFTSAFNIESTAGMSTITVYTNQLVLSETFEIALSSYTTTFVTSVLGANSSTSIDIISVRNGVKDYDTVLDFTASLTGSPGWSFTTATNLINLTWDPDYVNNSTGTYTSTLNVSVPGAASKNVANSVTVGIDYSKYRNLSYWLSPAAAYNSLIGVSFDIIDNIKTVTIGVGMGADGSPIYANGGSRFATTSTLGIKFMTMDSPYPYWATVCRIPLDEFPATYLSGALDELDQPMYIKKTTDGLNYADYFGFEQGAGSIFIVNHDGGGNVTIEINNLRELSGDAEFDATLQNLTRAFYYYSQIDLPVRYNQLTTLDLADPRIPLFRGFSMYFTPPDTNPKWAVETSHVRLPT